MTKGPSCKPRIAFGPQTDFPSWSWLGSDMIEALSDRYEVSAWGKEPAGDADVTIIIKFFPPLNELQALCGRSAVVFMPVDIYGSAAEIEQDWRRLACCDRVIVHNARLERYFRSLAPVSVLDHHVKFAPPTPVDWRAESEIVWTGSHANIPPLAAWCRQHPLPRRLRVVTDVEITNQDTLRRELGFEPDSSVVIEKWTPAAHWTATSTNCLAIDIKGSDFRQRHKPATKVADYLASGLAVAVESTAGPAEWLQQQGFDVASPLDTTRWLCREYHEECRSFGAALAELLRRDRVAFRLSLALEEVMAARRETSEGRECNGPAKAQALV